jgi:asparaginyl-tRNA synthetase
MGWVKSFRANRFIALNDGTTMNHFQVVLDLDVIKEEALKKLSFHACIQVTGTLANSQGSGQEFELIATAIEILGENAPEQYPLQPKRQTMEYLRQKSAFENADQYLPCYF